MFNPDACVSSLPGTTVQRLELWKMVLAQLQYYSIMHISCERNCSGNLLSTLVIVAAVKVRAAVVLARNVP